MKDMFNLLKQAQEMQGQLKKIQDDLENMTVTGSAGGGMVTADVNGQGIFKRVKIDRSVVDANDVATLEDLIAVAVSDAQRKAAERAQEETSKLTGGLNLPFKLPGM